MTRVEEKHVRQAVILVVDDEERNRKLMEALLVPQGYRTAMAEDGPAAIKAVDDHRPDLVLLDVMMPVMDGYEVCRRLKERDEYLPVLMITSLSDRDSRLKGIESGADDFLSKPVDRDELRLKVRNFLSMKQLYDKLDDSYRNLKESERQRENLTAFIVHDLKSPLSGVLGYLTLLSESPDMSESDAEDVGMALQSTDRVLDMIADLLDVTRMEGRGLEATLERCSLAGIVAAAVQPLEPLAREKSITIEDGTRGTETAVMGQQDLLERVVRNIVANAVRYTPSGGAIVISIEKSDTADLLTVAVSDTGQGIPPEFRKKVFDKFRAPDIT